MASVDLATPASAVKALLQTVMAAAATEDLAMAAAKEDIGEYLSPHENKGINHTNQSCSLVQKILNKLFYSIIIAKIN